jgi:zinc protease
MLLRRSFFARSVLSGLLPLTLAACAGSASTPAQAPAQASAAAAANVVPSSPPLPLDPKIVTGTLKNGLTYYLEQHRAKDQRAQLFLVVKAGSLYEEEDQRGLAHFVEHMAFSGTRRFPKQSLVDFFEKSGLELGAHANAMTLHDRTQYQLSVPTDDPKLLASGLDVLLDWAGGLSFDPDQIQKERAVLLAEWTSAQGATRRVSEQQRQLLLEGSRYAEREVSGDKAILQGAPRERIVDFYRRWYRPERMAVIVVGDIDTNALRSRIEQQFSALPAEPVVPGVEGPPNHTEELPPRFVIPVRREPTAAVITDPELPAAIVNVVFKAAMRPVHSEADYRAQLLSMLSTLMLGRRLDALSQQPEAPFTGASSDLVPGLFGSLDLLQVSARAKEGKVQATLEGLLREVERVKRHGFSEAEYARTKTEYARFLEHMVAAEDTIEGVAIASGLANQFMTGNVVMASAFQRELGTRLLQEVSIPMLNQTARDWFTGTEELLLASGPERDVMPDKTGMLATLAAAPMQPVDPYHEEAVRASLLDAPPTPGTIVKEEQIPELGVSVWTLSNGARVVLKPTDFKDDQIVEQSVSFGGTSRADARDFPSARFANEVVVASGMGSLDRQSVQRLLAGKVVTAFPWIDEQDEGIRASSAPRDAETMFQLIYLYATAPREDAAAFERYRGALREALRNRDLNPQQVFSDAVAKKLWGDQPRRSAPTLASVDEMKLDVALKFYKQRFADMSDFVFVFVGKIDLPSFRPLVERYLASLPGGGRKEKVRDLGLHRRKGVTQVRVQQGKEDKASVTFVYHGETPWSENANTDLVSLESYLSIRLREVLREQLGGVYTPYVGSSFERTPIDSYSFAIAYECKSADVEKLREATRSVIAELKKSGVDPSYIEKLQSQRTRGLEESFRSNGFWLESLLNRYKMGEDPRKILSLKDLTQRITSDNLKLAARKFLRDDQYVDAVLVPADAPAAASAPASAVSPATAPPSAASVLPSAARPPSVSASAPAKAAAPAVRSAPATASAPASAVPIR